MNPLTGRIDVRDDAGFSAAGTLLKLVVFLGVPAVLAFDALSCVVNHGLADGIAEGAARSAGDSVPDRGTSNQEAYDKAAAYLAREDPAYTVLPESVRVDHQAGTISLAVQRTAPTVVFRYADFSRQWTQVEGEGTVTYRP